MLKKLASQTATYGLTSILGRLIGNLLLPLQTARLSLRDFSVLSEILAYAAVLSVVFPLGLETALFRYSNDDLNKKEETEQKVISIQILVSILLLPVSCFWLGTRLTDLDWPDLWIISATLASDGIAGIFLARIRNHNKSGRFLMVRLGSIGATILLNILFLSQISFFDRLNPIGVNFRLIVYINFFASLLTFFFMPDVIAKFRFVWDRRFLEKALRFSVPIVLISIVGVSNDIFGRVWLESLTPEGFYGEIQNKDLIGIYSGCAKVAIFINLGIQAYRYAADPFFFSIQDKKDTASYLSKSFTWFMAAGLLALVAIECNIELIVKVFLRKPEFLLGIDAIFILLLANLFFGVYYNLSFWYKFSDRTYWGTLISLSGLAINAALNFFLVPIWGMTGSALSLFVCYLFMCVFSWAKSKEFFSVQWAYGKVFSMLALAIGLCFFSRFLKPDEPWVKNMLGLILPLILLAYIIWLQKSELFKRFKIESPG
jgi:O-antigen/teichoic acid export membrane protein